MEKEKLAQAESFADFVKSRLTAAQFERLHELLGTTKNAVTRMLTRPSDEPLDMVLELAERLDCPASELVKKWGVGVGKITLMEANDHNLI